MKKSEKYILIVVAAVLSAGFLGVIFIDFHDLWKGEDLALLNCNTIPVDQDLGVMDFENLSDQHKIMFLQTINSDKNYKAFKTERVREFVFAAEHFIIYNNTSYLCDMDSSG